MAPAQAWTLFRSGWKFYVGLWGVTFGLLILLAQGIPHAFSTSWVADATAKDSPSLLEILIPSDPFTALSRNYVPAVVLFSLFYGVALQYVPEKTSLLSVLEGIRLASLKFWNGVVQFAPVAVFALFADLAGTIRPQAMAEVSVFLFLFFAGALILTFWIVPGCIAAFTPFKHKEVLRDLRSALLIVVATTLSVSALPYISSATQRLAKTCGIDDPNSGEIVRTNISVAYPLGQLGNFFVYLFIVFALFFNGVVAQPLELWLLPVVTLLSCVGSPTSSVDAVTFLARWLDLLNFALCEFDDIDAIWSSRRLRCRFCLSKFRRRLGLLRENSRSLVSAPFLPARGRSHGWRRCPRRTQVRCVDLEPGAESLPFL
jgi:proton glutamate symport protein